MPNVLGAYDPVFYASEALIWLRKSLGFGSRVHRGYEPGTQQKGKTITIRRPMTFTATNMPSTPTDLTPDSVNLLLDQWKGVTFQLTDQELAYTKEQIVTEHIALRRPTPWRTPSINRWRCSTGISGGPIVSPRRWRWPTLPPRACGCRKTRRP